MESKIEKLNMDLIEKVIRGALNGKTGLLITPYGTVELKPIEKTLFAGKKFDMVFINEEYPLNSQAQPEEEEEGTLTFDIPYEEFSAMSWGDVVKAIEDDLLTHGGDVIINGYKTVGDTAIIQYTLHFNHSQAQPEGRIYRKRLEDLTDKELKEMGITKTRDTPEEWEEEFRRKFWLFDVDKDNNFSVANMRVIEYIRQLLDEREREVLEKIKLFDKRLDWYNEHTHKEHTVGEQLIVQNIQSDFINEFKKELVKLNKEEK